MYPFSTPWKHQKTVRFSDFFNGVEKGCIGNKWVNSLVVEKVKNQTHLGLKIEEKLKEF